MTAAAARHPGLTARLLELADELRREGVAVGTSELLDAVHALEAVSWTDEWRFREALAATLAKSPEDRRVFELVFERFLFRATEHEAVVRGHVADDDRVEGADRLDADELRERLRKALREGADEGELRDLARLALAAFGRPGEGSKAVGVDMQRIRRELELCGAAEHGCEDPHAPESPSYQRLRLFERHLRQEIERAMIERTGALPASRPLREWDRGLPSGPLADLESVHRVVAQLKRRLATRGHDHRGRRRSAVIDVRATMRASLQTGGVPLALKHRPRRPRRPELYVLCDVSTSVTSASVFFLSVLHALHDSFRRLRTFVFVERISEVTELFERERSFAAVSRAIADDAGVADVSGYTDYGRVWLEFLTAVSDDLDPRSTVIVLGDARTNGRKPQPEAFAAISQRAGRLFWLNPEPRLYWNYGDSVIDAYAPWCDGVLECWTARQLEAFADALADPRVPAR